MKTMLALALVGLLSISSLAEAKKQNPQDKAKIKTVQRGPSSAELNCPRGFVKITGSETIKDFCISKKVEDDRRWEDALSNCEGKKFNNRKARLCNKQEWSLACNQKKSDLGMETGKYDEWVAGYKIAVGEVLDVVSCNRFTSAGGTWESSFGSRCCFAIPLPPRVREINHNPEVQQPSEPASEPKDGDVIENI
jgi:hypothetical protein